MTIDITPELIVLGGGASFSVEFLRALFVKHDGLNRLWKFFPPLFGVALILLYPEAVGEMSLPLLCAHGAGSPAAFYAAYPLLKKAVAQKTEALTGQTLKLESIETQEVPPTTTGGES